MTPEVLLRFMNRIEPLKSGTRHCVTQAGTPETVAAHSWRLAVFALLLEDEFPKVDVDRLLRMCLIHDIGEAVTGDVPSFQKTEADQRKEEQAIDGLLSLLPDDTRQRFQGLFLEMAEGKTEEARLWRALDKLEAVIQHNESPLDSWLPLEYTLNLTYGEREVTPFPFLVDLRLKLQEETREKLDREGISFSGSLQ
ncbi:MAG: HD domain-containing protein [Oscillospiraceae bacterium]|jgi:putative hydrolase of HD superfamily|nr:HD domain-containing protein [Oscillospiraceae bacterium]